MVSEIGLSISQSTKPARLKLVPSNQWTLLLLEFVELSGESERGLKSSEEPMTCCQSDEACDRLTSKRRHLTIFADS